MSWWVVSVRGAVHGILDLRQEMLDLAAFVSPPPLPRQDLCHSIEYLASECSLVFRYPKGISKVTHPPYLRVFHHADCFS